MDGGTAIYNPFRTVRLDSVGRYVDYVAGIRGSEICNLLTGLISDA
jgi:hypothetical protein